MRFIQHSCVEGEGIDLRQADAVLRHSPDIIIFESPRNTRSLGWPSNSKPLAEKLQYVKHRTEKLNKVAHTYPWVLSEACLLKNVVALWESGHRIDLYDVDAPSELLRETIKNGWNKIKEPRRRGVHFPWWVYIYLRERMMANNLKEISERYVDSTVTVLVAMQKFHWLHVQYIRTDPAKSDIFKYYFGAFSGVAQDNINAKVKSIGNPSIEKYWDRVSDFAPAK
jgi:hypothetical protein